MNLHIIPGHGGNPYDPGALGNGYKEAEQVRILAKRIKELGGDQVTLVETEKDWLRENRITTYPFPKGTEILELHLDAFTNPESKGGHVIIDADFNPDSYDVKLAEMITTMFPGRSEKISKRNLGNTNRAQTKGVSYRLMECCFITNKDDIYKFVKSIEELARKILKVFGITPVDEIPTKPVETPVKEAVPVPKTMKIQLVFTDEKGGNFTVM